MPAEVTQELFETPEVAAPEVATEKPSEATKEDAPVVKEGEDAAPKTPLEAAKRVMAKEQRSGSEAKPQDGTQTPERVATDAVKETAKATDHDDDANLPFKDDPRWKKMSSEHRMLKKARDVNETAIKSLEPKAKAHDGLVGYFSENNLSQQDVANGLSIMAALRNDPAKAYEALRPIMERLETMVGVTLPADIRTKLEGGQIDADTAQELARARASTEIERSKRQAYEERQAREREQRVQQSEEEQMNGVVEALNSAETEWAKSDPDAVKLKPLLNDAVMAIGGRNPPSNAEEARELFRTALEKVRRDIAVFAPRREAKDGIPPVGGASMTSTAPVPKSSLEAAMAALR